MARKSSSSSAEAPGQDSFLDVVANLVGILIILIIVVGGATGKAMVEATESTQDDGQDAIAAVTDAELAVAQKAAADVEAEIYATDAKIRTEQLEVAYRRLERDKILTLISAAERAVSDTRNELDADDQSKFDLEAARIAAKQELDAIQIQQAAILRDAAKPGVLEHLPTPMAKTVFGREVHFRLGNGRLAYVPWDELVEQLKSDAPDKIWRLREAANFTETIGPVDGFLMHYTLRKTETSVAVRGGTAVQQRVELDRFTLVPVADDVGEAVTTALKPGSDFMSRVEKLDPNRSTITIWVYPDSFAHFRTFKKLLFDRGFLTAARPLPDGHPLGGSPDGSRSAAE